MDSGHYRKIWTAGVALSDAWLHFAADAARQDFENKPGFDGTVEQLLAIAGSTSRDGKLLLSTLQTVGNAHLDVIETRKLLRDALIEVIAAEGLLATGYAGGKSPVPIDPPSFLDAEPDWEKSSVRVNGSLYERVRITDPAEVDIVLPVGIVPEEPLVVTLPVAETVAPVAKDAPLPVKAAKPKKPKAKIKKAAAKKDSPAGKKAVKAVLPEEPVQDAAPPAVSALADPAPEPVEAGPAPVEPVAVTQSAARSKVAESIRAALERLVQEQEDFGELARRTAAQKIRDQLGASYEKGNGLSDPNLSRYIRRKCGPKLSRPKA